MILTATKTTNNANSPIKAHKITFEVSIPNLTATTRRKINNIQIKIAAFDRLTQKISAKYPLISFHIISVSDSTGQNRCKCYKYNTTKTNTKRLNPNKSGYENLRRQEFL
jgi:hypothetical protein